MCGDGSGPAERNPGGNKPYFGCTLGCCLACSRRSNQDGCLKYWCSYKRMRMAEEGWRYGLH
jgi:hypothetical protein